MTPFRGQTENAGHFLQLATMAIGHNVIALLLRWQFMHRDEFEVTHGHHRERVEDGVRTNSLSVLIGP